MDKYALEYEGTLQYDKTLPKLDQFTLCAWMRFTNHSGDHTIFTYSGEFSKIILKISFMSASFPITKLYGLFYWIMMFRADDK